MLLIFFSLASKNKEELNPSFFVTVEEELDNLGSLACQKEELRVPALNETESNLSLEVCDCITK